MDVLARDAAEAENRWIHARALVALAEVALTRDSDVARSKSLGEQALQVIEPDDHAGRFEALHHSSRVAWWSGDLQEAESFQEQALDAARAAGRKDLESVA